MGLFQIFSWGLIFQAAALVHFIRRRPDTIWLWIIIFFGPFGALIYIVMEVVPDLGLLQQSYDAFGRRKRIAQLQGLVIDNPAAGNYEELADLLLDEGQFEKARDAYDKAITPRTDHIDPFYRRGIAKIHLGEFASAVSDLEHVTTRDPKYDSHRAVALLAHAYANAGEPEKAEALFRQATEISTLSETYFHYAAFLAGQKRHDEAREWAQKILTKKVTMPRYLHRLDRVWFQKATALMKTLKTLKKV